MKVFCRNRKAFFNYEVIEKYEAGIELHGPEIKYLTTGKSDLSGSYAKFLNIAKGSKPELYLIGTRIGEAENADRSRRLLMHRKELTRLISKINEKNLTLVPLMIYGKNGRAKVEIALAKGKKEHNKKETLKRRDIERQIEIELK